MKEYQQSSKECSMNSECFFTDTRRKIGVLVPAKITLDNKITKALGWMPNFMNLRNITKKGRDIIKEYRNL